jgi:hypothetical protein
VETEFEISSVSENVETMEKNIIGEYSKKNPADFNKFLPKLIHALSMEKNEDEKSGIFEERLISEIKNILELTEMLK